MTVEPELARKEMVLVRGTTNSLLGTAILTEDRIQFFHTKFAKMAGGILEDVARDVMKSRFESTEPELDLPLTSITGLRCEKKLFGRDRLAITTPDGEVLFGEGWRAWSPLIRNALTSHHGRRVVEEKPDAWRVEASP